MREFLEEDIAKLNENIDSIRLAIRPEEEVN